MDYSQEFQEQVLAVADSISMRHALKNRDFEVGKLLYDVVSNLQTFRPAQVLALVGGESYLNLSPAENAEAMKKQAEKCLEVLDVCRQWDKIVEDRQKGQLDRHLQDEKVRKHRMDNFLQGQENRRTAPSCKVAKPA